MGYAKAQYNLGYCFANGQGVSKKMSTALFFYRQAAEQGVAEAQSQLASYYEQGIGVKKDLAQAAAWRQKAMAQGRVR